MCVCVCGERGTDRQTDRQTDRDRQRDRQTDRDNYIVISLVIYICYSKYIIISIMVLLHSCKQIQKINPLNKNYRV